jgi:chromosome segregation ATPase
VRQLVREYERAKGEIRDSQAQLSAALSEMGVLGNENQSLSEQLRELLVQCDAARQAGGKATALQAELDAIRASLDAALASVGSLSDDKRKLADRGQQLSERLAEVFESFTATRNELDAIRRSLTEALTSMGSLETDNRQLSDRVAEYGSHTAHAHFRCAFSALFSH